MVFGFFYYAIKGALSPTVFFISSVLYLILLRFVAIKFGKKNE